MPSLVFIAIIFNLSLFPTSDGSLRKKQRTPPESHSAFPVLEFVFPVLLCTYLQPEAVVRDTLIHQEDVFRSRRLFRLFSPSASRLQAFLWGCQALYGLCQVLLYWINIRLLIFYRCFFHFNAKRIQYKHELYPLFCFANSALLRKF